VFGHRREGPELGEAGLPALITDSH
jgi:hypothetical protein